MTVTVGGDWKPFIGYEVSSTGDVRKRINVTHPERYKPYIILKKQFYKNGYVYYKLNGKNYLAHRLVYSLFVGGLIDGLVVCHKDGNKTNNTYKNLMQATQKENISHKALHGTWQEMEAHPRAKIDRVIASKAKSLLNSMSIRSAASKLGISMHIVADISCGKTWRKA